MTFEQALERIEEIVSRIEDGSVPLEESIDNKTWIVGTPEDVAEGIAYYRDTIGLDYITLFPQFAGDPYGLVEDQLHRFREEVVPLL